jgi:hypothetical protein
MGRYMSERQTTFRSEEPERINELITVHLGCPIVRGRGWRDTGATAGAPMALVNQLCVL